MVAPLEGLRVVEYADDGGGEWLGKLLAGLGAEMLKVEPPEGTPSRRIGPFAGDAVGPETSLYFWHFNAGKRSQTLDTSTAEGLRALRRLIADADVFIETLAPGEAAARGLSYAALSALNPRLVHVAITPFGQDGPYVDAGYRSTDLVTLALAGTLQACGYDPQDELPPMRPGAYHSHYTAGHYGCIAALVALWEREASGLGQYVDVAAQSCLAVCNEFSNLWWEYAQEPVRRQTGRHAFPHVTAPMNLLCADERYINIMLPRDERTWRRLVAFMREYGVGQAFDDALITDASRRLERSALAMADLEVIAALLPAEEMFHTGQAMGMTWGAVRAPEDWLPDPHAAARDFFVEVEQPAIGRSVVQAGAPVKLGATPMRTARAPRLGEHNAAPWG